MFRGKDCSIVGGNQKDWGGRVAMIRAAQRASSVVDDIALRRAMADLWHLTQTAPPDLRREYRSLDEATITDAARIAHEALVEGRLTWNVTDDWRDAAISIGGQLRALDAELANRPSFRTAPSRWRSAFRTASDIGAEAFVIPRHRPRALDRRPGPGNGFRRRGTPFHRIIPRTLDGGIDVTLFWNVHLAPGAVDPDGWVVGAALFPEMAHDWHTRDGVHVAQDARCPDEGAVIATQVERAFERPLFAAAWPELSMPPRLLSILQAELKVRAGDLTDMTGPGIIAAGSWHEPDDADPATIRNVMRVLDRSGIERLRFHKLTSYQGSAGREGNAAGRAIPIVVTQDALVGFAICSDFCDVDEPVPFLDIDIDLLIVVSLGNAAALEGHSHNARSLAFRYGTKTLVVQQHLDNRVPLGWVIPADPATENMTQNEAWCVRRLDFSGS